jgi:hypothetical protein
MTDIATDLIDRFWVVELGLLEKWEAHGLLADGRSIPDVWNENEHRAMELLKACRQSVDTIPDELMQATKAFLESNPVMFERTAMSLTSAIGVAFFPANATMFCELLNENLQRIEGARRVQMPDDLSSL